MSEGDHSSDNRVRWRRRTITVRDSLPNNMTEHAIYLSPGVHTVTVDTGGAPYGGDKELFRVMSFTGNGNCIVPHNGPVKFIAIDTDDRNYHNVVKTTYKRTVLSGPGQKSFTTYAKRFKIYMVGASVPGTWGSRPDSAETSITGGGINYKTGKWADLAGDFNGGRPNNKAIYKYHVYMSHSSSKHNEREPICGIAINLGIGETWDGWGSDLSKRVYIPGYLENALDAGIMWLPCTYQTGRGNAFNLNGFSGRGSSRVHFGPSEYMIGCSGWSYVNNYTYGNPGGYARDMNISYEYSMGLSKMEVFEIVNPNPKQGTTYTINIGRCPQLGNVDVRQFEPGHHFNISVANEISLGGGALILEEI